MRARVQSGRASDGIARGFKRAVALPILTGTAHGQALLPDELAHQSTHTSYYVSPSGNVDGSRRVVNGQINMGAYH